MKEDKELFDLCKQVYEATGWRAPIIKSVNDSQGFPETKPLYTSDYLLERLQETENSVLLKWNRDLGGSAGMKTWDGKYCAGTFYMPQREYPISDTPLKTLLKLTLKLHEEKLL